MRPAIISHGVDEWMTPLILFGHLALPARPDHQVVAGDVLGGAQADVTDGVGVEVDQLQGVVALFGILRHRQHDGFVLTSRMASE